MFDNVWISVKQQVRNGLRVKLKVMNILRNGFRRAD